MLLMKTLDDKLKAFFGLAPYGNCQVTHDGYFAAGILKDFPAKDISAACARLNQKDITKC